MREIRRLIPLPVISFETRQLAAAYPLGQDLDKTERCLPGFLDVDDTFR